MYHLLVYVFRRYMSPGIYTKYTTFTYTNIPRYIYHLYIRLGAVHVPCLFTVRLRHMTGGSAAP